MKKVLTSIFIILFFLALTPVVQAGLDMAFGNNSVLSLVSERSGFDTQSDNTLESTISNIISLVLSFLGLIFISLLVYAGVNWMTAGGNEQKVESSKKLIKQSIIGLIVVLGAYAISFFIISALANLVN